MNWTNRVGKWLVGGTVAGATCVSVGCLTRPVGTGAPTTKVNFTSTVSQQQVDKVDILFMIDNSASMGDKQAILSDAVPNLLNGLLQPKCVDQNGVQSGTLTADPNGDKSNNFKCPAGTSPEFNPVTDMHIGIISSSLGSFGGDVCPDSQARANDHAHLLNLVQGGSPLTDASPSNFLSWFPTNTSNADATRHPTPPTPAIKDLATLNADFQKLVTGVQQNGCGLEAQMESWYHFLVQPDPWVTVSVDGSGRGSLGTDIDVTLLQQRADFLREDSLVAVVVLTDEDDSSADPLSVGGQGWAFEANKFPGSNSFRSDGVSTTAPRPTSICATNPAADGSDGKVACTSCGFATTCDASQAACQLIKADPNCQMNGGFYGPTEDSINVRFIRMKERYGIDPQYPISRYTNGLSKTTAPDRAHEHPLLANGGISAYVEGAGNCTNPLFAKNLPRNAGDPTCQLARSTRTADLIFFAVVGGVPNNLLHFDPTSASNSAISDADWIKILGKDPVHFDYSGIDNNMIQSIVPRPGLPGPSATRGDNGVATDPSGREWTTNANDLQYACTFDLPTPRSCTTADAFCDCDDAAINPPLCGATLGQQVKAKAYPTVREFEVVRALGQQGIIASLCPISLTVAKTDPTYGYNPAVTTIINRLKNALTTQCLPQQLTRVQSSDPTTNGDVACLVLAQLGAAGDTCARHGLPTPDPTILAKFLEAQKAASGNTADGGVDLSKLSDRQLPQLVAAPGDTCKDVASEGWCYVENGNGQKPAGNCPQALIFSAGTADLAGAQFSLQCIQQFSEDSGTP